MRFERSNELPGWIAVPILIVTLPVWGSVLLMLYVETWLRRGKRALLGPRVGEWQRWFAWHAVTLDGGWGETVWLEVVERQAIGTSYGHGIVYQDVGKSTENTA